MALADPQELTVGAATISLPRTGAGESSGIFRMEDGNVILKVSHNRAKRSRSVIRIEVNNIVVDPLLPAANVPISSSFQLVADRPIQGMSVSTQKDALLALAAWLSDDSGANAVKFLGGES